MLDVEWAKISTDIENLNSNNMFDNEMVAEVPVGAALETHDMEQGKIEQSSVNDGGDSETGIHKTQDNEISILVCGVNPADFAVATDKSQPIVHFLFKVRMCNKYLTTSSIIRFATLDEITMH